MLVFLCHATEDKSTVERLARALMASGINTFFDSWEIRAGDSLRRKIDEGIGSCTHFIVVLSPVSIQKPWVNAELDAGFVAHLADRVRLIPLRLGLAPHQLPPLLSGRFSPALDDFDSAVSSLISDILGVTQRPPLGTVPSFATHAIHSEAGLSILAGRIAAFLIQTSKRGRSADPQLDVDDLRAIAEVPDDDIAEAVDELESRGWVTPTRALVAGPLGFVRLLPTARLFSDLDAMLMPWNPREDARTVAAAIVNSNGGSMVIQLLAHQLGWTPRRMNPAVTLLVEDGVMDNSNSHDAEFEYYSLHKNISTRRFLRG